MIEINKGFASIHYDEKQKLLKTVWNGFANGEEYRAFLNTLLDFYKKHEVLYSFSDNRNMKAIRQVDQEWTNDVFLAEFFKISTIKRAATIVSEDIFNRMAVDNIMIKANKHITFDMKFFDSENQAIKWLLETESVEA
jgi:hypothetical protein